MKYKNHSWPVNKNLLQQCCHCGVVRKSERTTRGYRTLYEKLDGSKSPEAGTCDDKLLYAMRPTLAKQLQLNLNQYPQQQHS